MGAVLAVGAHPDDVELLCAGTLALLRGRGWRVAVATMTAGDLGSATLPREETARVRREEARRAAEVLEAESHCLGAADFQIFFGDDLCRRATALLRTARPDLVLTHPPEDYLADHEETSRIVRQACFASTVPRYETGNAALSRIPHLYYFDPVESKDRFGARAPADLIVDISKAIETKTKMLACHASQREWLRVQHGCDQYLDEMRAWGRARGREIGAEYGEGFRRHRGHAFPQDDLLQEALS